VILLDFYALIKKILPNVFHRARHFWCRKNTKLRNDSHIFGLESSTRAAI